MEGNNANHYTSHADDTGAGGCIDSILVPEGQNGFPHCILRGSNPRGLCPLGLKSSALTTRPRMRVRNTARGCRRPQKSWCSQSETRTHNLPVNSRARCRLRHPGTLLPNTGTSNLQKRTACGDRTRDQSIKSRTLYLTELRRPVLCTCHTVLGFCRTPPQESAEQLQNADTGDWSSGMIPA